MSAFRDGTSFLEYKYENLYNQVQATTNSINSLCKIHGIDDNRIVKMGEVGVGRKEEKNAAD